MMRRFRVRRWSAVAIVLGVITAGLAGGDTGPASAAREITVTASSTAAGTAAQELAEGRTSGTTWRSDGRVRGVALTTRFARTTPVHGLRIDGVGGTLRIVDARIEFSDGSALAVRTDAHGDRTLRFPTRQVRWVRLVVETGGPGQRAVGLAGWTVQRGRSDRATAGGRIQPSAVSASSGRPDGTRWTAARAGTGQWLRASLHAPTVVSAVRLRGDAATQDDTVRSASLRFSDGSTVPIGTLEPRGGSPTTVAFTPRVTSSVSVVVTAIRAGARAAVRSVEVYPVGVVPAQPAVATPTYRDRWQSPTACSGVRAAGRTTTLRLLCPSNGRESGRTLRIVVSGPAGATLTARALRPDSSGGTVRIVGRGTVDAGGTARLRVDTRRLVHGPTAIRLSATGVRSPLYVQFVNTSGVTQRVAASRPARGMDLKYADGFSGRLSATRTGAGATYSSGKPNSYGVDDFGEAIFAQPSTSVLTASTMPGGYLRIPARALTAAEHDPAPYGRRSAAGLISSAHMGGSGFSAQYGYFEARMLAPGGSSTWPAFWLLSTGSLVGGGTTAEFDVTELYGNEPRDVYQTAHSWKNPSYPVKQPVYTRLPEGGDTALVWHTYGARVTPTGTDFYIDGMRTGQAPRTANQDEPFFFLANLALTGDWRTGLAGTGHRADLYIDFIRVWV